MSQSRVVNARVVGVVVEDGPSLHDDPQVRGIKASLAHRIHRSIARCTSVIGDWDRVPVVIIAANEYFVVVLSQTFSREKFTFRA